jgi:hypothetical protein
MASVKIKTTFGAALQLLVEHLEAASPVDLAMCLSEEEAIKGSK